MIIRKTASLFMAASLLAGSFLALWGSQSLFYRGAYPRRYAGYVERFSREFEVDRDLVYSVIRTESGFKPRAQSSVGARGLMQITEDTFRWLQWRMGEEDGATYESLFEPEVNIRYGAFLLSELTQEFGSAENALCAYHAGWGKARQWLEDGRYSDGQSIHTIPYGDTRRYVGKVLETREIYRRLYRG